MWHNRIGRQLFNWRSALRVGHSNLEVVTKTRSEERLDYFNAWSKDWWDPNGSAWILHQMNSYRIPFIQSELGKTVILKSSDKPLEGLKILDVGCGGGFISEALARLGAKVTGLDPSADMIKMARHHSNLDPSILPNLTYVQSTVEEYALRLREHYDVIVAFFVLEHVTNRQEFINSCFHLLKPNGSYFIQHANRTLQLYSIYLWEMHITGRLPKRLVTYRTLLKTTEILKMISTAGNYNMIGDRGLVKMMHADLCWTNSKTYWRLLHMTKCPK